MASFGISALSILSSVESNNRLNNSIDDQSDAVRRAAQIKQQQLEVSADLERRKRFNELQRTRGALRVAAGEAGTGFGGSLARIEQQAILDNAFSLKILDINEANQIALSRTGVNASLAQLESGRRNVLLDAVVAGIGGFSTGLKIDQALSAGGQEGGSQAGSVPTDLGGFDPLGI